MTDLLKWLPVIVLAATVIAGAVRNETRDEAQDQKLIHLERLLGVDKLTNFAKWQTDTEWRLKNLEQGCR